MQNCVQLDIWFFFSMLKTKIHFAGEGKKWIFVWGIAFYFLFLADLKVTKVWFRSMEKCTNRFKNRYTK